MSILAGRLGHIGKVGFPVLFAAGSVASYHQRVRQGQNPAFAATMEGGMLASQFLLSTPAQLGLFLGIPAARLAGQMVTRNVSEHNTAVRASRTPFSHRFEHTDTSARAQSLGMRQVGAAWGHAHMGSEAALFSRRYGR